VVAETSERAAVMFGGEVVELGSTERMLSEPSHAYTRALIASIPRLGDARRRLPTVAGTAPELRDERLLPREARIASHLVAEGVDHWVRREKGENA
jgi:ABC-type dipeptide/oligopeptide/nickel transport system ATPase component